MFPYELYSQFEFGDMTGYFFRQEKQMLFALLPHGMENEIPEHQSDITETTACKGLAHAKNSKFKSLTFENMIQCHVEGAAFGWGYYPGETMLDNETARTLEFVSQDSADGEVRTVMQTPDSALKAVQIIRYNKDEKFIEINTELENCSGKKLTIDQLSSFQLGMVSPFAEDDGPDRYKIHRYTAYWGAEGRHVIDSAESLGLERAWVPFVGRAERFGQRTTLPVKRFFPTLGVEDQKAGVVWGVQLAALGPWQLEITRKGDFLNIGGGLPDREFAGWFRYLKPGEKIRGIPAVVSVTKGSMDSLLNRLTAWQTARMTVPAAPEKDLPPMFNEYCTTWGTPDAKRMYQLADVLKGHGLGYFVMDAGWFRRETGKGDWDVATEKFPEGLKVYCRNIRERGMIPGVWFEFEQVSMKGSRLAKEHPEMILKLHGANHHNDNDFSPLDFRRKDVRKLMHERVIDFLRDNGFGYMKVDYNITVSGADTENGSSMEGLLEYLRGAEEFFREIKRELPDLVLEICASGGHRLTAGWMALGDMGSFSDDHEDISIPLVAAGTARQIALSRNQVWAVLHDWDDDRRLCYSLAAGFMGRLCISGDVDKLNDTQKKRMFEAVDFARLIRPLIANGETCVEHRLTSESWLHPKGTQIFRRCNGKQELIVIHNFKDSGKVLKLAVGKDAALVKTFHEAAASVSLENGELIVQNPGDFSGIAVLLNH